MRLEDGSEYSGIFAARDVLSMVVYFRLMEIIIREGFKKYIYWEGHFENCRWQYLYRGI